MPVATPQNTECSIFINYRREDSNWNALAIYNELQKYFSSDQIFKDFNAIRPGDDYVVSIDTALQRCDVLLVLIGSRWLDIKDANGNRRLEDPDDFVRLEIAKALARNIKVIPVMLDDTRMPQLNQLPENMQSLTRRQFIAIDPTRFEDDVRDLADAIAKILGESPLPPSPKPPTPTPGPRPNPHPAPTPAPAKPDNNMLWSILTTILCCPPLGIVGIINASKVEGLYSSGKYAEAQAAAQQAKKFALWGAGISVAFWILYFILLAAGAIPQP